MISTLSSKFYLGLVFNNSSKLDISNESFSLLSEISCNNLISFSHFENKFFIVIILIHF